MKLRAVFAFLFLCSIAIAQSKDAPPPQYIQTSGKTVTFVNPPGSGTITLEYLFTSGISAPTITVQGCGQGGTCTTLTAVSGANPYTTAANAMVSFSGGYFQYNVTATYSGTGTITVSFVGIQAKGGSGGGALFPTTAGVVCNTTTTASVNCPSSAIQSALYRSIFTFWGFGDSFMQGAGMPLPEKQSGFALIASGVPAPSQNFGQSGITSPQVTEIAFQNFGPSPTIPSVTFTDSGANDGDLDTCGGTTTSGCALNYKLSTEARYAFVSIPYQSRIFASNATATGTWSVDTNPVIFANPLLASPGSPLISSANSSTLNFSIPSSSSPVVGLTYFVTNGQTGTFTVSVDGTLQTDACSGTTTFSSGPCSAVALVQTTTTFFRQEFSVTPGTTHTIVVTQTSSQPVDVVSADWVAAATNTNVVFAMGPNAGFGNATTYETLTLAVATQLHADGLPIYYASQINGAPGVNDTTDVSQTATATCSGSLVASHPNSCGYANMAQTLDNVALANNYVFSVYDLNQNQINGTFPTPITVNAGPEGARANSFSNFNPNTVNPASQNSGLGIDFFHGQNNTVGIGFGLDMSTGLPFSGNFINKSYGSIGWYCHQHAAGFLTTNDESGYTSEWCIDYSTGNTYQLGNAAAAAHLTGIGTAIASATTIAPAHGITHVTGTAAIATITPLTNMSSTMGGCITLIADGIWTTVTGGNIISALTAVPTTPYAACYDGANWYIK